MVENNKTTSNNEIESDESCCNDTSCCAPQAPVIRTMRKIGRNDPCPCSSGRKYKKCCGQHV